MPLNRSVILQAATAVTLTLVLVWAATQWAAVMLGQQPALGTPWISFAGVAVMIAMVSQSRIRRRSKRPRSS
jgi:membrane protein implicated in regulation of membrane protease activity